VAGKTAFILAGEPSGDRLGSCLMAAAEAALGPMSWIGMGGESMKARGLVSDEDMSQLSVIGIAESLGSLRRLSALADRLADTVIAQRPDFVFTIDAKGFSLRFARRLRVRLKNSPYRPQLIHMVAPTVWAWGRWRARSFARVFDSILCLFPMEPDYFSTFDVRAEFIGHPDGDACARPMPALAQGIELLLLPGSRRAELHGHLPVMLSCCRSLCADYPDLRLRLALPKHLHAQAGEAIGAAGMNALVRPEAVSPREAFKDAHLALASSGTVTLEAAIAGVPAVVIYKIGLLTRVFVKLFFKPDTPVLPDILLGQQHYPFLVTPELRAGRLARLMSAELKALEPRNQQMQTVSAQLKHSLRPDGRDFAHRLTAVLTSLLQQSG